MPRSIWKGAISFGLVTIPIKMFSATEEKDISFRQVHPEDGGRIKYKRVCDKCDKEIPYAEIGKGYETPDGRMAILEKSDFDNLPLATTKAVEVVQFTDEDQVDPSYFDKSYFLQADGPGVKPYVLLRDALTQSGQVAVVKVAMRSRESLALIRVKDDQLLMHTMLWPDELRDGQFAAPPQEVTVSDSEVKMAQTFIEALKGDFEPESFSDSYREALEEVVQQKLSGVEVAEEPEAESSGDAEVVDLVAALRASVEAAKKRREGGASSGRGEGGSTGSKDSTSDADSEDSKSATTKKTAKKAPAKKTAAKKTAATKKSAAKKTASKDQDRKAG